MSETRAFFPPRSRLLVGIVLLIVTAGLTFGYRYSLRGPLQTLEWFKAHRAPGDSLAYASAAYHASHAQAAQANRWRPTGYATLGLAGILVSLGLIASSRSRRTTPR